MSNAIGHNGGPAFPEEPKRERAGNWFAVSREIFDHPIVGIHDRAFTETEAWLYLLSLAAYAPTEVENKGATIVLDPGQVMAAYAFLARRWAWGPDKVRWYLKRLQNEAMITRYTTDRRDLNISTDTEDINTNQHTNQHAKQDTKRRTNQIQILTICNYAVYQNVHAQQHQAPHQTRHQATHQPLPQESNTSNTSNTLEVSADAAEPAAPAAPICVEHRVDHGVLVNGKTIRHETGAFVISLPAVQAGVKSAKWDEDAVNAKCLSRALQWGAAIEAGQSVGLFLPESPADSIIREVLQEVESARAVAKADRSSRRGTRLPADWRLPRTWGHWALQRFNVSENQIRLEAERFRDYWLSASKNATKVDWERAWRVWCSSDIRAWRTRSGYSPDAPELHAIDSPAVTDDALAADQERARMMMIGGINADDR